MNYIPSISLFRFLRIVIIMGGLSLRGLLHLLPWVAKLIILESLRLAEVILFEKKINNHRISESPVIILGHYRSRTTYLQRLFSFGSRFGQMSVFEHVVPELLLLFEKPFTKIFQWITDLFKAQNYFHRVQHDWSYPGEEDIALMSLSSEYSATWAFMFPKIFEKHFIKNYTFGEFKSVERLEKQLYVSVEKWVLYINEYD